jgi:hypothetical protein
MSALSFFSHYWPQKTQEGTKMYNLRFRTSSCFSWRFLRLPQLTAISAILLATTTHAQNTNAPGQVKKTDPAQTAAAQAAVSNGMTEAKALAKSKNINALEAKLGAINHAKPNTAAWHIELSHRLIQIADQLARENDTSQIAAIANLAVQHLTQADTLTTDIRTRSAAKTLIGFIQERYLADTVGAIASYDAAAKISPKANAASEAGDRLRQAASVIHGGPANGGGQ